MQRLGELNNKVIVEQKTAPENKHVIWKDPIEGKFKEFKESGWVESEEISVPSSPISPEDITPEILDDNNFRQRIRLYGRTVEEVEQLIDEGKCIWAHTIDDKATKYEEDILYNVSGPFMDENYEEILKENLENVQYILYSATAIVDGILLHRTSVNTFNDATWQFVVSLNDDSYTIAIGNDTL